MIFFNKIIINKPAALKTKGPLLLACNHPNSFLDAVLLDILFERPVWSLARGDVFKKPFYSMLLLKLKMLPVYRTREGVENLEHNYKTFEACKQIFKQYGCVLIFSEGLCVNEWHLRTLKKGTARLAVSTWIEQGTDHSKKNMLQVLPVGINYSSFSKIGKNVFINFGDLISSHEMNLNESDGKMHLQFNQKLQAALQPLVFEIEKHDKEKLKKQFALPPNAFLKILFFIPSLLGYFLNAPLYLFVKWYVQRRLKEPGHFDSVMLAMLSFLYPIYVVLFAFAFFLFFKSWYCFLIFILLPILAKAHIFVKNKTD